MSHTDKKRALVLFDGDCGFCRWSAGLIERLDRLGRIRTISIQSPTGQMLLEDLSPEEQLDSWHIALPDGNVHSAGDGVAPLLRLLPRGNRLARLAERFPRATEAGYRFIANRRSFFGRLVRLQGEVLARWR